MWKNGELKRRAKKSLKANYWVLVLICFVMIFFGISSSNGDTITSMQDASATQDYVDQLTGVRAPDDPTLGDFLAAAAYTDQDTAAATVGKAVVDSFKNKTGILYKVGEIFTKLVVSSKFLSRLTVIIYALIMLAFFLFIKNPLVIGFNRVMIESHTYGKTKFSRIFHVFRSQGFLNAVWVYFRAQLLVYICPIVFILPLIIGVVADSGILIVLGLIGVVAGFIVSLVLSMYLYWTSYILACDTKIQFKKAVKLSISMTKGNFWHMIGFFLSFIPWHLLSILTLGLLDIFFLVPYKGLAYGELFLTLRQGAIDKNAPYANRINGIMMGCPHPYLIDEYQEEWAAYDPEKRAKLEAKWAPLIEVGCYPVCYPETNPIRQNKLGQLMVERDPMRKYSILNLILCFFIFAFLGWAWEVALHIVKDGMFVNRGTMHGPWLPIYGAGGVMIIVFLRRFAKKPLLLMVTTFVLCGIVEYCTSWFLEVTKGTKWWDYSNHFLNLNGRICLEGLLVFSIAGLLFVYIAGPALDNLLNKLPKTPRVVAAIILLCIFGLDMWYSHYVPNTGKGITDYGEKKSEVLIESSETVAELPDLSGDTGGYAMSISKTAFM